MEEELGRQTAHTGQHCEVRRRRSRIGTNEARVSGTISFMPNAGGAGGGWIMFRMAGQDYAPKLNAMNGGLWRKRCFSTLVCSYVVYYIWIGKVVNGTAR